MMLAGIVGVMAVAGQVAPKLQAGTQGLLAFGGAVLMASAGMSLMAIAATQVAAAGPTAMAALALMEGGMLALLAVAGALGPSLTVASVGLVAFGASIVLAASGCLIMVQGGNTDCKRRTGSADCYGPYGGPGLVTFWSDSWSIITSFTGGICSNRSDGSSVHLSFQRQRCLAQQHLL